MLFTAKLITVSN